jgi:hypothetical protein
MSIARSKGATLPCGRSFDCASSIFRSPAIFGIHLTEYALALGFLAVIGLVVSALIQPYKVSRAILLTTTTLPAVAAIASNAARYVIDGSICVYCLAFMLISVAAFALLVWLPHEGLTIIRKNAIGLIISGSVAVCITMIWLAGQLRSSIQKGVLVGVSIEDILANDKFALGHVNADLQIVCFYSPTCKICVDEIGQFRTISHDGKVGIRLRALPPEGNEVARTVAGFLLSISTSEGSDQAATYLALPSDLLTAIMDEKTWNRTFLTQVDIDFDLGRSLNIHETPTCIMVQGNEARFIPCSDVSVLQVAKGRNLDLSGFRGH